MPNALQPRMTRKKQSGMTSMGFIVVLRRWFFERKRLVVTLRAFGSEVCFEVDQIELIVFDREAFEW